MSDPTGSPMFIRGRLHPDLAFTVGAPEAGQGVTTTNVAAANWNTPLSQWIFTEVGTNVYQIGLFASEGQLLLTASAPTENSKIQVEKAEASLDTQLWSLAEDPDNAGTYWVQQREASSATFDIGYSGFAVSGTELILVAEHGAPGVTVPTFTYAPVKYPNV